jgi:hypothetical protein
MDIQTANSFSEYYKTITDAELISILDNKEDYQEAAVKAAEEEFSRRQLSTDRLEELKNTLAQRKFEKEEARQKREAVERTVKEKFTSVIESLNPIHREVPGPEKILRFIIILWGLLTLYQLINDYEIELRSLKDFPFHPFMNSILLFPYVILPVSIYQLWRKQRLGWTLFVIYLTFRLLVETSMFYYALTWEPTGFDWMDKLIKPSIPKIVLRLLFAAGTLFAMCRQNMRSLFSIDRKKMALTISITAVVSVLVFIGLMNQ